jgi:hypothetical protein
MEVCVELLSYFTITTVDCGKMTVVTNLKTRPKEEARVEDEDEYCKTKMVSHGDLTISPFRAKGVRTLVLRVNLVYPGLEQLNMAVSGRG